MLNVLVKKKQQELEGNKGNIQNKMNFKKKNLERINKI